jgi:uncharacterized protein DUF1573
MKFLRPISLLALILVCAVAASARQKQPGKAAGPVAAETGPQPLLVIESATHDFGELKSGTPLRFAFKIKNSGNADLLIESVSPG